MGTFYIWMHGWEKHKKATKLVENIDSRIKNKDLAEEIMLRDIAQSKLREAGVKLDCLGSFLHNPPSKPNLYVPSLSHLALMRVSPSAIFLWVVSILFPFPIWLIMFLLVGWSSIPRILVFLCSIYLLYLWGRVSSMNLCLLKTRKTR